MNKIKQHIDTSEEDRAFIEEFVDDLNMLTGMTIEMMETNPVIILSPLFRRSLADKAKVVKEKISLLRYGLCVDNPGENLRL